MAARPRGDTRCAAAGSLGGASGDPLGVLQASRWAPGADQRTLDLGHPLGQGVQIAAYSANSARDNRHGFGNGGCALIQATALQSIDISTASRATPPPAMGDSPRHSQASPCSTVAATCKPESGARDPKDRSPVTGRWRCADEGTGSGGSLRRFRRTRFAWNALCRREQDDRQGPEEGDRQGADEQDARRPRNRPGRILDVARDRDAPPGGSSHV